MADMTRQQALSALDPQTQLSAMEQQRRQRKDLVSVAQQKRQFDMKKAQDKMQNLFQAKKFRLKEKEMEAAEEYNKLKTDAKRAELNQLKIKNQVMDSLNNKKVTGPGGEDMTLLEAKTLGVDLGPDEDQFTTEIVTADGQKKFVSYNGSTGELNVQPIGEATGEEGETAKKWSSLPGLTDDVAGHINSIQGVDQFSGLRAEDRPVNSAARTLGSAMVKEELSNKRGSEVDPNAIATRSLSKVQGYYDNLGALKDSPDRSTTIKLTSDLIKDAVDINKTLYKNNGKMISATSSDTIRSTLENSGYSSKEATDIMKAAKSRLQNKRR